MRRLNSRVLLAVLLAASVAAMTAVWVFSAPSSAAPSPGHAPRAFLPVVARDNGAAVPSPSATRSPTATTTPTMPPGVFVLDNSTSYVSTSGYTHIVGEVMNNTNDTLRFVRVSASLFDLTHSFLDTGTAETEMNHLSPHTKTCFRVLVEAPDGVASYEFEAPTYQTNSTPLPQLTLVSRSGRYDGTYGWYRVSGQVRNDETTTVNYVTPVISLYDATGHILGCDYTFVNSTDLAPGQTSAFGITLYGRDFKDVSSFNIQVDGDKQ